MTRFHPPPPPKFAYSKPTAVWLNCFRPDNTSIVWNLNFFVRFTVRFLEGPVRRLEGPVRRLEGPVRVLSQTRIFGPPPPPYQINFAKNRKKSESTQNGLKRREIEKKILPLGDPPPEKNLEKFSKIFLKIFWKLFRIIWNVK